MAKLVIGTTGSGGVPAMVKEIGPVYYKEFTLNGTTLQKKRNQTIDFTGVTTIEDGVIDYLFQTSSVAPDFKNVTTVRSMRQSFKSPAFGSLNLKNVTTIGDMSSAFSGANSLMYCLSGTVDLGALTTITGADYAFSNCSATSFVANNLTTIDSAEYMFSNYGTGRPSSWRLSELNLSSLTTVTSSAYYMFSGAKITRVNLSGLDSPGIYLRGDHIYTYTDMFFGAYTTHVDLSGLTSLAAGYHMFNSSSVQYVNFKNLESIPISTKFGGDANDGGLDSAFNQGHITVLRFPSLTSIGKYAMYGIFNGAYNTAIHIYFYHHLDVIANLGSMSNGRTGITVHFPISEQAVIGSESVVTGGYGSGHATTLFDIVTEATGADGNTYTRRQKDSPLDANFEPTATAWTYNDTLYYTAGASEPQVGDTIYSDTACTTAVTTISAIA